MVGELWALKTPRQIVANKVPDQHPRPVHKHDQDRNQLRPFRFNTSAEETGQPAAEGNRATGRMTIVVTGSRPSIII
jgi:hypothetical protein